MQRFLAELSVAPVPEHPGTTDFYDAVERLVGDWKVLGPSSIAKVQSPAGPPRRYKVQLLLYYLGIQALQLPAIRIALIALPRTEATLDHMYIWECQPGPDDIALLQEVLRVTAIRRQIAARILAGRMRIEDVPIKPDEEECYWCPFWRPQAFYDGGPGCREKQGHDVTLSQQYPVDMLPVRVLSLTQDQIAIIDPENFNAASLFRWSASRSHSTWYVRQRQPRNTERPHLHAFLTGRKDIDHINGNGLDNRQCNLRPSYGNNNRNRHSHPGSSLFKGVTWHKGKWQASLKINGVSLYLGRFAVEEDAARAYDTAAREHHGAYGRYNFPQPGEQPAMRLGAPTRLPAPNCTSAVAKSCYAHSRKSPSPSMAEEPA